MIILGAINVLLSISILVICGIQEYKDNKKVQRWLRGLEEKEK